MMTTKVAGLALAFVLAAPGFAQAGLTGTWKADFASANLSKKPETYSLKDGVYSCKTCTPPYTVKADGAFHPTPGHPYFDEVSIKVVSPTETLETDKLKGKVATIARTTVSADGKTATTEWQDMTGANGKLMKGTAIQNRVGAPPAGEHATSGSWVISNKSTADENSLVITIKASATSFAIQSPTGEHYTATFGGPYVPIEGDVGGTEVAVKKLPDGKVQIDVRRKGKPTQKVLLSLAKDGKSITYASTNLEKGTTSTFTAKKVD